MHVFTRKGGDFFRRLALAFLLTLIYVAVCIYDTQILNGFFSLSSYVQKYWNNLFYHYKVLSLYICF